MFQQLFMEMGTGKATGARRANTLTEDLGPGASSESPWDIS